MHLVILLTSIPVGLAAVLHWHWLKDHIIEHIVWRAIEKVLHALASLVRRKTESFLSTLLLLLSMPSLLHQALVWCSQLIPDLSAELNKGMILCGLMSLACAAFPTKLRPALLVGGLASIAVGMVREAARRSQQQLRLAA
jgi:hypothetical protein